MAKSSGSGGRGATSIKTFAKNLGFSLSEYRGTSRLTRDNAYVTFKDKDSLTSFLGKVYSREVQQGKPKRRYGKAA